MYALIYVRYLHSYVLLFLCLYYFMFRALAGIVVSLRLDPWSWPGMTVSQALVVFSGCLLVFRQKNIGTKDSLNVQMSVQASLTYLCPFNVCTFGAWLSAFLLVRTQVWVFTCFRHKNIRT